MLRNADIAMYTAKRRGKGRYEIFLPAMHLAATQADAVVALGCGYAQGYYFARPMPPWALAAILENGAVPLPWRVC